MALVFKVLTPPFFSEKKPYMYVFFREEFESKFRMGSCENPNYMNIYDLRIVYPELTNVYEAETRFMEEMEVGHREPIYLHEFAISDLTDGKHLSVRRPSSYFKEIYMRVGSYHNNNGHEAAQRILDFCIEHGYYKWDD